MALTLTVQVLLKNIIILPLETVYEIPIELTSIYGKVKYQTYIDIDIKNTGILIDISQKPTG